MGELESGTMQWTELVKLVMAAKNVLGLFQLTLQLKPWFPQKQHQVGSSFVAAIDQEALSSLQQLEMGLGLLEPESASCTTVPYRAQIAGVMRCDQVQKGFGVQYQTVALWAGPAVQGWQLEGWLP
jgi:hypothetical protein